MSKNTDEVNGGIPNIDQEELAIGLVATRDNCDAIVRSVFRANCHGYDPLIIYSGNTRMAAVELAEQLGATTFTSALTEPDRDELLAELTAAARAESYTGVILHENTEEWINYHRSAAKLGNGSFAVEGVSQHSPIEQNREIIVGIPAYNEETTIYDVVTDVTEYADIVIVVDDGSDDDTAEIARNAGAIVVEHESNGGYGKALKTLFSEANDRNADSLVVIDADGQHDAADIPRLCEQLNNEFDIVIGSRFTNDGKTNAPIYRRIGLTVVNMLTNISMGVIRPSSMVQDTQSGFRAYSEDVLQTLATDDDIGDRMNASTDILYHAHQHDYEIEEVGTTIKYDGEAKSTRHPLSHGFMLVQNILNTVERKRPMTVLGVPGTLSLTVGFGFAYWALSNYISTNTFPLGLAIISVFFTLLGIFSCFTGIILHSLNRHFN